MSISIKNTTSTFSKGSEVFKHLEKVAQLIPTPVYWLDKNGIIMGANEETLKAIGLISPTQVIGKTVYDIYPKEIANPLREHQKQVIRTKQKLTIEETIVDTSGNIKHFTTTGAPLCDDQGNIIGIIGTSVDITEEKKEAILSKKAKVLEHLEKVAQILPTTVYWLDTNHTLIGANEHLAHAIGIDSCKEIIGKTAYDVYPKKIADKLTTHQQEVIRTGKILTFEESTKDASTNEIRHFNSTIAPFYDDDGNIMGTIGTSIEITSKKEAERLALENEKHKTHLAEQEKFSQIANQVVHDIRSPLASLTMLVKACAEIPELQRIALREAVTRIEDIANHLLNQYKSSKDQVKSRSKEPELLLTSAAVSQLLTEKKYEYRDLQINWHYECHKKTNFSFIKIEPDAFKRTLSNLLNNAVDSLPNKEGKISIKLNSTAQSITIDIKDNGIGIPSELIEKIRNNIPVTAGKEKGHGIGLVQVRDTLDRNQGTMAIESMIGQGTCITLTFPTVKRPQWVADQIILNVSDIIVVLDDDPSIHGAWDSRFNSILKQTPQLQVKHFISGKETIEFINQFSEQEKQKIYLLADYELLKQTINGLDVIQQTQIQRSILVTSHFTNLNVRARAEQANTRILPKQLASEILINIDKITATTQKTTDIIIVDDDQAFARDLSIYIFGDLVVDQYHHPDHFLENISQYHKSVKIYLDNNFKNSTTTGLDIAKQLYDQGYTELYLLSGEYFMPGSTPSYITFILKTDIHSIKDSYQR